MRAVRLLVVVALAGALAGCLGGDEAPDSPEDPETGPQAPGDGNGGDGSGGSGEDPDGDGGEDEASARRPSLSPGLAWRYNVTGHAAAVDETTVVVARAGQAGYLFAGSSPSDLHGEVTRNRSWLGWQTEGLNPKGDGPRLFDFPLEDGKTWSSPEGTVTAERAEIEAPMGTFEGYRMTVDGVNRTWTYAPDVGYLVTYEEGRDEVPMVRLGLESVGTRANATWYTSEATLRLDGPGDGTADVANASAIVLAGGGDPGATVAATAPTTSQQGPWVTQVREGSSWAYERRAPAEGTWRLSASAPPEGTVGAALAAVTWTELAPRYGSST